jgi:hypothetical protein
MLFNTKIKMQNKIKRILLLYQKAKGIIHSVHNGYQSKMCCVPNKKPFCSDYDYMYLGAYIKPNGG